MTPEHDEDVINSLWRVIKIQHEAMTAAGSAMELLFDVIPEAHKPQAAKRMDIYNQLLDNCDKLVARMREIMEHNN